jgi:hypothetical protein
MATTVRAQISEKNKYYIDKHRHYELKHYCRQYPSWKKAYVECLDRDTPVAMIDGARTSEGVYDPVSTRAATRDYYSNKMEMLERVARDADKYLWQYILKAVTEGLSYTYLRTKLGIPCGKDMYYDRYRRFFWLLSEIRG